MIRSLVLLLVSGYFQTESVHLKGVHHITSRYNETRHRNEEEVKFRAHTYSASTVNKNKHIKSNLIFFLIFVRKYLKIIDKKSN